MFNMDLKVTRFFIIIVIAVLFHHNKMVFAQFSLDSEIRPRFEYRNGYGRLPGANDKPAYFISQRSRLNLHYKKSQFEYVFSMQDVRVWGDATIYKSTGIHGSEASLDLHQAYFEWMLNDDNSLSIGRQTFFYGDQRLISKRNWNHYGMSYDALLLKTKFKKWDTHLGVSLNNNKENKYGNLYESNKMKTMNFIHLQRPLKEMGHLSLIAIGSGYTTSDSSEVIYMRGTTGTYLQVKIQPFDYSFSGYYQFGKNKLGISVQAYLLASNLSWRSKLLSLSGGFDYVSGDAENSSKNKDRLFSILYGSRHRYYGNIDYFSNLSQSTNSRGLIDLWLRMSYDISSSSIQIDFHRFSLQDNQLKLSDFLGTEIDIILNQQFNDELKMSTGLSIFQSSKYFQEMQSNINSDRIPIWAWIMLDFKLNLIESNKTFTN